MGIRETNAFPTFYRHPRRWAPPRTFPVAATSFGTFKRPLTASSEAVGGTTTASSNRQAPRTQQFPLNYRCTQCGLRLEQDCCRGNVIHTAGYVGKKLLVMR
ncbi:hypothetical protein BHM03_00045017 [Ensete ventricosum]|nr:hypothetical protein BHM03_00045017 [Ensete ventricosum]